MFRRLTTVLAAIPLAAVGLAAVGLLTAPTPATAAPAAAPLLRWGTPASVDPPNELVSISCVSRTLCRAGDSGNGIQRWNGTDWLPGNRVIDNRVSDGRARGTVGLSCTSTTFCAAAQLSASRDGRLTAYHPVVRNPDGTWFVRHIASQDALRLPVAAHPVDVSCAGATFCMLVNQGDFQIFDGFAWTNPNRFVRQDVSTQHVSCVTASMCRAVSEAGILYSWNGTAWSAGVKLEPPGVIVDIDCASIVSCTVLTHRGALRWNGSVWGPLELFDKNFDPSEESLLDLACPTASFCAAVDSLGYVFTHSASGWGGRRQLTRPHQLEAISCPGSAFCVAITQREAIHYVDGTWQAARLTDAGLGRPYGVSCYSGSQCVLADAHGGTAAFDGSAWTLPVRVDRDAGFSDVSCTSADFCVGAQVGGTARVRRDGAWSEPVDVEPDPSAYFSVDCGTPRLCTAYGGDNLNVYRWDGTRFLQEFTGNDENVGTSAACGPDGCVEVRFSYPGEEDGYSFTAVYHASDGTTEGLPAPDRDPYQLSCLSTSFCMSGSLLMFDGARWSDTRTHDGLTSLDSLSCATPTFCVGVDDHFAYAWDGTSWGPGKRIFAEDTLGFDGFGLDVSCTPVLCVATDRSGWAVAGTRK